jgi:hypothetical protein
VRTGVDLVADVLGVQRQHGDRELVGGRAVVDLEAVPLHWRVQGLRRGRGEVQHAQQFGDVDVLGVSPPRKTLSELAITSTPTPCR